MVTMTKETKASDRPALWKVWWTAARPHTLTASLSPVIVGHCATWSVLENSVAGSFGGGSDLRKISFQWACFCMLIQLGTNLHNDYADFVKGADTDKRVGQARATQKGWLTPAQTAGAACTLLSVALLDGLNFISRIQGPNWRTSFFTFIITTSVFNAFAYTGGPFPLGYIGLGNVSIAYSGLGDLFVFLYFGLVATLSVPFLYITCVVNESDTYLYETIKALAPYTIQVSCLSMTIIIVNNLRDRHTDVLANKRTMAVRFGATASRIEYASLLSVAYILVLVDFFKSGYSLPTLLPMLSVGLAWSELKCVARKDGGPLNPHVGGAAKVQFLFCILLGMRFAVA